MLLGPYFEGGALCISSANAEVHALRGSRAPGDFLKNPQTSSPIFESSSINKLRAVGVPAGASVSAEEVENGIRLVANFGVFLSSSSSPKKLTLTATEQHARVVELLKQACELPTLQKGLGFPCVHFYPQMFSRKGQDATLPLTDQQVSFLKDQDVVLGRACMALAKEKNVRLFLQPYLTHDGDAKRVYLLKKFPTRPQNGLPAKMGNADIVKYFGVVQENVRTQEDQSRIRALCGDWIFSEKLSHAPHALGSCEEWREGACEVDFYVRSVFRVSFPELKKLKQKFSRTGSQDPKTVTTVQKTGAKQGKSKRLS